MGEKRHPEIVKAIDLAEKLIEAATEFRRQIETGEPDLSLLPADVLARLESHLFDNPRLSAAAFVSRACSFYLRNVLNCESVPPDLARLLLAGRPVETPEPCRGLAGAARKGGRIDV